MRFHFILNNERLALRVDLLCEFGGDGVMGGLVLEDETLVTLDALENLGLLDSPSANVSPFLIRLVLLLGMRCLPPSLPVVGKLF